MIKVFIDKNQSYYHPIVYTLQLIGYNKDCLFDHVTNTEDADIVISHLSGDIIISQEFYNKLDNGIYAHDNHFNTDYHIKNKDNTNDLLSTIFYMVNCVQEYNAPQNKLDQYGRFSYLHSYQHKFNVIESNLVQSMIDQLFDQTSALKKHQTPSQKSTVFLTHDIDILFGGWRSEMKYHLFKGKIKSIYKLLKLKIKNIGPWNSIDKLLDINDQYNFKSTFFWIPKQGTCQDNIVNADYNINSDKILETIHQITTRGFDNAIHKSTMDQSLSEELKLLPFNPKTNRCHFLKFKLPDAWYDIEISKIREDSSLMFANKIGFRNNYGKPFSPYNFKTKKAFNFIERPLHIMPGAVNYQQKGNENNIQKIISRFIENNKNNIEITILWHNNEYSDFQFKKYKLIYHKVLIQLNRLGIRDTPISK